MAKNKLTKADFELFKAECSKWIEKFNLNDNDIVFSHKNIGPNLGQMVYNYKARRCEISLCLSFDGMDNGTNFSKEKQIKETAFHEVAELLLARITALTYARFIDGDEIEAETHAVIHRIQRILLSA